MSREKRKAKKEAEKRLSTRQFIGAKEITDYSLVTYGQGELVYFIVKPTNISVLSESSVGARIYALMTVLKGVAEIGVKGLLQASRSLKNALLFNVLSFMSDVLLTQGNTAASLDEFYTLCRLLIIPMMSLSLLFL